MNLIRIFFVILLLAATVPWFATDHPTGQPLLPGWLLYGLLATLALVVFLELLIHFFWEPDEGAHNRE